MRTHESQRGSVPRRPLALGYKSTTVFLFWRAPEFFWPFLGVDPFYFMVSSNKVDDFEVITSGNPGHQRRAL